MLRIELHELVCRACICTHSKFSHMLLVRVLWIHTCFGVAWEGVTQLLMMILSNLFTNSALRIWDAPSLLMLCQRTSVSFGCGTRGNPTVWHVLVARISICGYVYIFTYPVVFCFKICHLRIILVDLKLKTVIVFLRNNVGILWDFSGILVIIFRRHL